MSIGRLDDIKGTFSAITVGCSCALTLLVGRLEGHPACKKLGVGLILTGALHVLWLQLLPPHQSPLAPTESRMGTFWYLLTQVHLENGG